MTAQTQPGSTTGGVPTPRTEVAPAPRPRLLAAVLLLALAAACVVLLLGLYELLGVYRSGPARAALSLLPLVGTTVMAVAVAGYVLTGSRAARVLGSAAAVGLAVQVLAPLVEIVRTVPTAIFPAVPAGAVVVLLTGAVVVALALPQGPAHRSA